MELLKGTFSIGGVTFDTKLTTVIIFGTILPLLDAYRHSPAGWLFTRLGIDVSTFARLEIKAYDRIIYYLIIPLMVIVFVWWENPKAYGFQLGNWREGALWVIGSVVGMSVVLWFITNNMSSMSSYYSRDLIPREAMRLIYITGLDLLGWEFIWRGFMLFAMAKIIGVGPAIWLQAVPFAFMHLGKPEIETMSTIFGGAAFGFIAWRTDSFAYPFLIHWYIASFTQLVALGRF